MHCYDCCSDCIQVLWHKKNKFKRDTWASWSPTIFRRIDIEKGVWVTPSSHISGERNWKSHYILSCLRNIKICTRIDNNKRITPWKWFICHLQVLNTPKNWALSTFPKYLAHHLWCVRLPEPLFQLTPGSCLSGLESPQKADPTCP